MNSPVTAGTKSSSEIAAVMMTNSTREMNNRDKKEKTELIHSRSVWFKRKIAFQNLIHYSCSLACIFFFFQRSNISFRSRQICQADMCEASDYSCPTRSHPCTLPVCQIAPLPHFPLILFWGMWHTLIRVGATQLPLQQTSRWLSTETTMVVGNKVIIKIWNYGCISTCMCVVSKFIIVYFMKLTNQVT